MIKIILSGPLKISYGDEVSGDAGTFLELINSINEKHPEFGQRVMKDGTEINPFITFYLINEKYPLGEDLRYIEGINTPLKDGDVIDTLVGLSGG